jgi:hypothetical protein
MSVGLSSVSRRPAPKLPLQLAQDVADDQAVLPAPASHRHHLPVHVLVPHLRAAQGVVFLFGMICRELG